MSSERSGAAGSPSPPPPHSRHLSRLSLPSRRRASRDSRSGETSPSLPTSGSASPSPAADPSSTSSSSSSGLSLPPSLLSASATAQQAVGSWWKKANALYQQATQPHHNSTAAAAAQHDQRIHSKTAADDGASATQPAASSSTAAPASSSSSSSAPPSSSFFSSVLSSVAAAVSTVTLPSASPLSASTFSYPSSFPPPSAISGEPAAAATADGPPYAAADAFIAFHELDISGREFRHGEAILQQLPAEPSVSSSSSSSSFASKPPASAPLHPFLIAHQRMSLLSSVLSDDVGGFLSPHVFFPHSCLFLPSLRLPAVQQQLAAMETIEARLEDVRRVAEMAAQRQAEAAAAAASVSPSVADSEQLAGQEGLRPVLDALSVAVSSCHRLQNELAFSLTAIKETTTASASSAATAQPPPPVESSDAHDAAQPAASATEVSADGSVAAEAVAAAVSLAAVGAVGLSSVDRLSNRVKALGYSIAKSAHRMSKQVMQDRLTAEQALSIIALTQCTHAQLTALLPVYHEAADRARAEAGGAADGVERELLSRFAALGLFVCDVLVVLLLDDAQRALLRYMAEQQEQLTHNGLQSEQRRQQQQQQQEQAGQAGLNVESVEQGRAEETPAQQTEAEAVTGRGETVLVADQSAAG